MPFLFVGERRSPTAIRRGWTWWHGRLAGRTLVEALQPLGLRYGTHYSYHNLWTDTGATPSPGVLSALRGLHVGGWHIVALGKKVADELTRHQVPHIQLTHPAARGAIRKRERYHAHVRAVLTPYLEDKERVCH